MPICARPYLYLCLLMSLGALLFFRVYVTIYVTMGMSKICSYVVPPEPRHRIASFLPLCIHPHSKRKQSTLNPISLSRTLNLDYGFSITADEELVMYVCYGVPSQALLQWLTQHIGSAGIRKLARATDQALLNIHRLLNLHAQPALEQLVFRLGEVLGMQRCAEDEAAAGCGLLGLQGAPLDLMEVGRDGGVATSGLRDLIEALEVLM